MTLEYPKQFSHIVVTAGISAISERNVLGRLLRANPGPFQFVDRRQNPELASGSSEPEALAYLRGLAAGEECRTAALASPDDVSAEYSLALALKRRGRLHPSPKVALLHTATMSGKAAAAAVASLMEAQLSCDCRLVEVANFDTGDPKMLQLGLGTFMHQVVYELRSVDASYACFAPQGGYKVMTSLGYVAGSFLNYDTAYLHEDNQTLHVIPPIPMALSPKEQADLGRLARQIERQPDFSALSERDRESVFAHPWLFEVAEEVVMLNAFAQFLGLETRPILLSPNARETLQNIHNAGSIRKRLLNLPAMVAQSNQSAGAYASMLYHEREFQNLNRPDNRPSFHIWKNGSGDFYVAWAERSDGALLINRIWGAGHAYTADAEVANPRNSQGLFDDPSEIEWVPMAVEPPELPDPEELSESAAAQTDSASGDHSGNAEVLRSLKRELKQLNRENAGLMQRNAELRKRVSSLGMEVEMLKHDNSVLKNKVKDLERQLGRNVAGDPPNP
jgi:putative CRISPR-associated protein (TIGR02619 family)